MDRRFQARPYRLLASGVLGGFAALFFAQAASGVTPGWVMGSTAGVLALRGARLGLEVRGDDLIVRSWLLTQRRSLSDVERFDLLPYSGSWLKGGSISWFAELTLVDRQGVESRIPPIVGRFDSTPLRVAQELNSLLAGRTRT